MPSHPPALVLPALPPLHPPTLLPSYPCTTMPFHPPYLVPSHLLSLHPPTLLSSCHCDLQPLCLPVLVPSCPWALLSQCLHTLAPSHLCTNNTQTSSVMTCSVEVSPHHSQVDSRTTTPSTFTEQQKTFIGWDHGPKIVGHKVETNH